VAEKLHAAELVHKDFRWPNVLWAGASANPFVIDLELAAKAGQQVRLPTCNCTREDCCLEGTLL
jgi:tRNA A-37 threonylcarbamoyl transferase component Bud32